MGEFTIELRDLWFFSFHGLYEEERKVGGEFIVDVFTKFSADENKVTSIDETINYASIYSIVKEEMKQPKGLLETLAQSIAEKIYTQYALLKEIEIRIEKKNPPIVGFVGSVAVKYHKSY
jgi:dihydroneopterin aldolase